MEMAWPEALLTRKNTPQFFREHLRGAERESGGARWLQRHRRLLVEQKRIATPGEVLRGPLSVEEIVIFAGGKAGGVDGIGVDVRTILKSAGKGKLAIRRQLKIGAEAGACIGLRAVLRQRIADEIGLRVASVAVAIKLPDRVLTDAHSQNLPRKSLGVGKLRELEVVEAPVVWCRQQPHRRLLAVGVCACPELVALNGECE